MKIMLVEDSATLRHAMTLFIQEAGHQAVLAQTGEEALQLLEDNPVDMIIMDVELPGLNGFETTRLIREWLGVHWIPIIFVTGRDEDESYHEGIEAGGDDYLIKPVSQTIIRAKIRAFERIWEMRNQLNQLNTELEALSQLDSLTQILNRRTFNEQAHLQWLATTRHRTPISLLMIDVDHFKLYNDHYGHPAGDACLKQISRALKDCLHRPFDLIGRYGGEEFIVLLPETDQQGARTVSDNLCNAVAGLNLRHEVSPTSHRVSISIGGAVCMHTTGHGLEELIKQADRNLYKAKRGGRDRAVIEELASHKTLLIADSNSARQQAIMTLMQPHCNLLSSDQVDECLDIARDVCPDLIVLEDQLADLDHGYLCRQLARNPKTAGIPILLLSEHPPQQRPASDAGLGIQGCLQTPCDDSRLLAKIQTLLS